LNKLIKNTFKATVSAVILITICYSIDFNLLKEYDFILSTNTLISLIALFTLSLSLRALRWTLLMNSENIIISYYQAYKLFLVGQTLNIVLPSGTGDLAKVYYGYKWTGIKERMFAVSLIDKLIAIGSILFITPISFYYSGNYTIIVAGLLAFTPFILTYKLNYFLNIHIVHRLIKHISKKIEKINIDMLIQHLKIPPRSIFIAFTLSIAAWIFTYILLHLCFVICGLNIPLHLVVSSIPLLTLGRLFPFTLNGIGSDEALILFLFSNSEDQNMPIIVAALMYRIILMLLPAIIGLPFILTNNKLNETEIESY
jgi:glycosyltransferase 2 family protein